MIEVSEAKRLLLESVHVLDTAEIDLALAPGSVLAEPIRADRDAPPTDRSAMDGFAVRVADLPAAGVLLRVAGEARAGRPADRAAVRPGEAVRIFTGAPLPPGADAVVMVELTEEDRSAGTVVIRDRPESGQNIRRRAEDAAAGETILEPGAILHAAEVAALASVGRTRVRVVRKPRVAVLSTGDEVVEPEATPLPHQVRNSNARTLLAQLAEIGIEGRYLGIARDERDALERAVRKGLDGDALLITGGVSVGEFDLVAETLERAGFARLFHKVAMRPGKPILAGWRDRCLVLGLPGNPVSTFTGFAVFGAPALRRMMGYRSCEGAEVRLALGERVRRRPGRTTYQLARVEIEDGRLVGRGVKSSGSGDVLSLVRANAFLIVPGGAHALEAGTEVDALLWREFQLR